MAAKAQMSARVNPVAAVANCWTTGSRTPMGCARPLLSGFDKSMQPKVVLRHFELDGDET